MFFKVFFVISLAAHQCFSQTSITLPEIDQARLYMASILQTNSSHQHIWNNCAAVFIAENHVLTAASCLLDAGRDWMYIRITSGIVNSRLGLSGTPHNVVAVHVHPAFNPLMPMINDIAIIEVDNFIHRTEPRQSRQLGQILPNRFCTLLGWEGRQVNRIDPIPINMIAVPVLNSTSCATGQDIYCTKNAGLTSSFEHCGGLMGSPVFCEGSDIVSGILVRDNFCQTANPVGGNFLSLENYHQWIDEIIRSSAHGVKISVASVIACLLIVLQLNK